MWVGEESRMALARVRLTLCTKQASCPAGQYIKKVNGGDKCVKCTGGRYREAGDASTHSCKACPAGKMEGSGSDRKSKDSSCTQDCTAGYYCPEGTESATKQCPKGYFCPAGSAEGTSRKCIGGYYCPAKSSKGNDPDRVCKSGFYCRPGSYDKFGRDIVSKSKKLCTCGYYCPSGSSQGEEKKCRDSNSGSSRIVYCPGGSRKPLFIPTGWIGDRKRGRNGPHCSINRAPKGKYSTKQTLKQGHFMGKCCPAGKYNSKRGQGSCSSLCSAGYFCPDCSSSDKVQECGVHKDIKTSTRYTSGYAASVYCPRGSATRLKAPEKDKYTTATEFRGWSVELSPNEDSWLRRRTNIAVCPDTYVCVEGVRAPALLWKDTSENDVCGGTGSKTGYRHSSSIVEIADDVDQFSSAGKDSLSTVYIRKLKTKIPATLSFEDDALSDAMISVTDDARGTGMWSASKTGEVTLNDGYGVDYEAKNGGSRRYLKAMAKVEILTNRGNFIEVQKACQIYLDVINSNDRPRVIRNQLLTIEEQSPKETLIERSVQAYDEDRGQTFEFELDSTWNDITNEKISDENAPFSLGKCSGIFKLKQENLFYDNMGNGKLAIRRYRMKVRVKDADQNDDLFADENCKVNSPNNYCRKQSTTVDVIIKVLNKNDPPSIEKGQAMAARENMAVGSSIGWLKWNDYDSEDRHIFRILQIDDDDAITVSGNSGEIKVKRILDYERKKKYTLKVSITDSGGWRNVPLFDAAWLTINVEDANDPPTIEPSMKGSVKENDNGVVILNDLGGEDVDSSASWGKPLTFEFYGNGHDNKFSLVKNSNNVWQLKSAENANINFESFANEKSAAFEFKVRAKDQGGLYSNIMGIKVEVRDVNEPPSINSRSIAVKEDITKNTKFGGTTGVVSSDPDHKQVIYYMFTVIARTCHSL